ncbi:transporter [Rhizobium sp. FY34]|uniref:transporter n=1 Tax=Rhizobium sp. FY34 TaxID=2562309 RepID=UPI0019821311|nr:transporter [Rhizobium sp. FY34]
MKKIIERCSLSAAKAMIAGMTALAGITLSSGSASAIDMSPADYTVLPDGTVLALTYFQYSTSDRLNVDGVGDIPGSRLDVGVTLLRGVYYSSIDGVPVSMQAILPVGTFPNATIGGTDQQTSDGFGDLTLGFTVTPVNTSDKDYGTTIGITTFLTTPTGNFDTTGVSLGSGTWTLTPQIGLMQGLGNGFFFDAAVDVAFQKDHKEDGLSFSRNPSTELQTYLRYQVSEKTSVSFGYAGFFGGASKVDDVATGLKTRSDQLRIFANTFVTPSVQLQGMLGTDINVEGGFKQDLVAQIRVLKIF